MKKSPIIQFTFLALTAVSASAAAPGLMNYQGILTDGGGNPVPNGPHAVVFTIYAVPSGGSAYWAETTSVSTNNGLFTISLGSIHPIPDLVFDDTLRWLGVKVSPDPEMSPRQRLTSVPYSLRVNSVHAATGGSINGSLSFGNSATPILYMYESGVTNPTRMLLAHSPASQTYGMSYDDVNDQMNMIGGGTTILSVGLDSKFVGVNRTLPVTGSDYFSISAPVGTGAYGGMYIATPGVDGMPFYGYTTLNHTAWTYLDAVAGQWRLFYNGDRIAVDPNGNMAIGTTSISGTTRLFVQGGTNPLDRAVQAFSSASSGAAIAGYSTDNTGVGVFGNNLVGNAGYFNGNTGVAGNLSVTGTVSKGGGSFKIDHPLDPAHKYLYHSFVESPDMKNIYDGVVVTDAEGNAKVALPAWFDALNSDFRYQLTVIGQFAQAIVSQEISDNQFAIRTDKPNVKVSWQVTGIRQDAFARANRIPVEEVKPAKEQGFYLYPEAAGLSKEKGVDWALHSDLLKAIEAEATKEEPNKK